jgi:hypothetical protein
MAESYPGLQAMVRANRAFLGRVVHHLTAERGVTQFLDLGPGAPTMGNLHEVAREANPDTRIVYVDVDPVAVEHARLLLADTLDLDRPVGVMMFALLHFLEEGREIVEALQPTACVGHLSGPVAGGDAGPDREGAGFRDAGPRKVHRGGGSQPGRRHVSRTFLEQTRRPHRGPAPLNQRSYNISIDTVGARAQVDNRFDTADPDGLR